MKLRINLAVTGCMMAASMMLGASSVSLAAERVAPPTERIVKVSKYFLSPQIGEVAVAEVGETLYREGAQTKSTRFKAVLKGPARSAMDNGYILSAPKGAGGDMLMRGPGQLPMLCFMTTASGIGKIFGDKNVVGCFVDIDGSNTFKKATFPNYAGMFAMDSPVEYEFTTSETLQESQGDFYVEVLYQGISKGEVKISYREFSNGIARPAFTQDITYEIEKNGPTTIGFKGLRLKVLSANNQRIEYILEQPMPSLANLRARAEELKSQVKIETEGAQPVTPKPWYQ